MTRNSPAFSRHISRRSALQFSVAGVASVCLPEILRAKEAAVRSGREKKDTSVIFLWLEGGPSHIDLYDMKPEAPREIAGIWRPIRTNVSGIEISELLPLQAQVADKFSIIRSLQNRTNSHQNAAHWMLTGRAHSGARIGDVSGEFPCLGAIAAKVLGARQPGMPPYVGVPSPTTWSTAPGYFSASYLGIEHNPFDVGSDPNSSKFQVRNLQLPEDLNVDRLDDRRNLLSRLDAFRRNADASGMMEGMDRFGQQAFDLVTGKGARQAFDISAEDPQLQDRYGRNTVGQSVLLARRLVEAGSTFVVCTFPRCSWDDHTNLQTRMEKKAPQIDAAVGALFQDLENRGLLDQVLVVMCGEFGRTPRINNGKFPNQPARPPGRDHWANAMFCLMGGGGVQGGRIVGATNRLGEVPTDRPVTPGDIHHTIYHVLGVDPSTHFLDLTGRPVPAIDHGSVIEELF